MVLDRLVKAFSKSGTPYEYPSAYEFGQHSDALDSFLVSLRETMVKQYLKRDLENESVIIRPSTIGKSFAFDLFYANHLEETPEPHTEKTKFIFSLGNMFESWLYYTLLRFDYTVENNVPVRKELVKATLDFIVTDDDGQEIVLEAKTCNEYYFKQITTSGMDNSRGYLTQAVIYYKITGLPVYWFLTNKATNDFVIMPLLETVPYDVINDVWSEAKFIYRNAHLDTLESILEVVTIPPPSIEKKKDGSYVMDINNKPLLYVGAKHKYPDIYYETIDSKTKYNTPRRYVKGSSFIKDYDELIDLAVEYDLYMADRAHSVYQQTQHWLTS